MNIRANITTANALPFFEPAAATYYRKLFWRTERVLGALRCKLDTHGEKIERIKSAFFASGTDDTSEWEAAYAEFEKYQGQFVRMQDYYVRLAVAVARQSAPA